MSLTSRSTANPRVGDVVRVTRFDSNTHTFHGVVTAAHDNYRDMFVALAPDATARDLVMFRELFASYDQGEVYLDTKHIGDVWDLVPEDQVPAWLWTAFARWKLTGEQP